MFLKKALTLVATLVAAGSLLAADSEPHMKVKVCNPAETFCADVSNVNALKTDATITSTVGSYIDKGSFTYGTDKFNPTGGIFQDTSPTLSAGQVGVSRMTPYRGLHVNLRDNAGDEFATINNPLIIAPANSNGSFNFGDITTAATTKVAVRRTTYNEQTTNAQRSFSSTDVDDDGSPADTGARTIHIVYFDQTGAGPFDETITLNGTTCVATVATNIAFVEHIDVKTVGATGSNEGTISMFVNAACGGGTIGTMGIGSNQTFWAHHYVATGKTANITGISVNHNGTTVGSGGLFVMQSKPLNISDAVEGQVSDFVRLYGQSSTFSRNYASPIPIVGPARVTIYVTPETGSSTVYRASMDFYEL